MKKMKRVLTYCLLACGFAALAAELPAKNRLMWNKIVGLKYKTYFMISVGIPLTVSILLG